MNENKEYKPKTFAEFMCRRQWVKYEESLKKRLPIADKLSGLLKNIFESKTCLELANGSSLWNAISAGFEEVNKVINEVKDEADKRKK